MIYLLLSVLSSTAIFVLFKLFNKYNVDTLQAIVFNYITACSCGILLYNKPINIDSFISENWFYAALGLGFLFISIFNVMALTAQKNGLSVASVASKMSMIIPIVFGIIVYNESIGFQKVLGIILALLAVYLTSIKPKSNVVLTKTIYLPIILFLGSGVIDTSVNHFAPKGNLPLFLSIIFACAGVIGLVSVSVKATKSKQKFNPKSIPFGIALGIVNYSSMYFLLKALRVDGYESSAIFTINNVAIVAVSCLTGLLLFKEVISSKNWIGIGLALISIILVTL
ncbi:DMT family transporter [Winogradskyella marincola]|uniref:DMT family transporter n=1 Tax=Winogradskyella marincola TaxID=3037795 RepID=A0ABT6G5L8_9FLAO|nr:DMT family transporter [Winogradskyella sp. YYF002]MDG4717285.1 DMT family transporter [Winogradskyella sp. YYF002]